MSPKEYPTLRKIFLQWMFTERIIQLKMAEDFFFHLIKDINFTEDEHEDKDFHNFLDYCRKSLNPINLNIKTQLYVGEGNSVEYLGLVRLYLHNRTWVICNFKSDNISHFATRLSNDEIDRFRKIIILAKKSLAHGLTVGEITQALSISRPVVQSLLDVLISNKWMALDSRTGLYYLGPRTLLELNDYLIGTASSASTSSTSEEENIPAFGCCDLCTSVIAIGKNSKCDSSTCDHIFHQYCIDNYFNSTESTQCPKCPKG